METKACYCVMSDHDCSKCDGIMKDDEREIIAKTYTQINFIGVGALSKEHNDCC